MESENSNKGLNQEGLIPNVETEETVYQDAVNEFNERIIVMEMPDETMHNTEGDTYTKYSRKVLGIACGLGIVNHEEHTLLPLPDSFESPFDENEMWVRAVENSAKLTELIGQEVETEDGKKKVYFINTLSQRAVLLLDGFFDKVCEDMNVMRLIVTSSGRQGSANIITVCPIENDSKLSFKQFLSEANATDEDGTIRKNYVYVKKVGMLSEAALNSNA